MTSSSFPRCRMPRRRRNIRKVGDLRNRTFALSRNRSSRRLSIRPITGAPTRVRRPKYSSIRRAVARTALVCHPSAMSEPAEHRRVHPETRIGHIHLKVADLNRALGFYNGVLGFDITQRYGSSAAFVSAGGYHHHIGLNTWESRGGPPPPPGTTGLYHLAIVYPTRAELADALRRLMAAGVPLEGASDHGVSEALYLRDPDGNGVEMYWDRPPEQWPRTPDGQLNMGSDP